MSCTSRRVLATLRSRRHWFHFTNAALAKSAASRARGFEISRAARCQLRMLRKSLGLACANVTTDGESDGPTRAVVGRAISELVDRSSPVPTRQERLGYPLWLERVSQFTRGHKKRAQPGARS